MSAKNVAPVLPDPGFGRTWVPELLKATHYNRKKRWAVSLMSCTGTLVGYIAEYDNGWGGNTIVRGKSKMVNGGRACGSAHAAAALLLKARKDQR